MSMRKCGGGRGVIEGQLHHQRKIRRMQILHYEVELLKLSESYIKVIGLQLFLPFSKFALLSTNYFNTNSFTLCLTWLAVVN